jgi:hypothetical protein
MCYVDWPYYEQSSYPPFKEVVAKCKEYGLYDIMGFRYNWNKEILAQFHASFYFNEFSKTIFWTTQGQKYCVDYMTFSRLLALGSKDETRDAFHLEEKLKPKDVTFMFFNPILAHEGKADNLQPYYYCCNQFFRNTIVPRVEMTPVFTTLQSTFSTGWHRKASPFVSLTSFGMS